MPRKKPRSPRFTREEDTLVRRRVIEANTEYLRLSDHSFRERIHRLLEQRGLDPFTIALVDSERGSDDYEEGIVATADGRVYRYRYDWPGTSLGEGTFTEFKDVTESWRYSDSHWQGPPHRELIPIAFEMLADERG